MEPSSAESVVAAAAAGCPRGLLLATRSDCDRSTRAALPAPFAGSPATAPAAAAAGWGGSGAFFFRPVPYLLSVSGRECNVRNCALPLWRKLQVVSPVPDEADEAAVEVIAAMVGVLRTVGDGLANLAGLGGVAGGVREDDADDAFFGFSEDVVFAGFGLFASVAAFAFSSSGFFAAFRARSCFARK